MAIVERGEGSVTRVVREVLELVDQLLHIPG